MFQNKLYRYIHTELVYPHDNQLSIPIHFRYMFWKIQSGIVPPFFYVIIGEKEKLKLLRNLLSPERQNTVHPVDQAKMVCTVTNDQHLTFASHAWQFHLNENSISFLDMKCLLSKKKLWYLILKTKAYIRLRESTTTLTWISSHFNVNFA